MSTLNSTSSLSKPSARTKIPSSQIAYIQTRAKLDLFNLVHSELRKSGVTQADLAARLGKGADRVCKILGAPGNWTIDTVSELLFAISGATLRPEVQYPLDRPKRNDSGPRWLYGADDDESQIKQTSSSIGKDESEAKYEVAS